MSIHLQKSGRLTRKLLGDTHAGAAGVQIRGDRSQIVQSAQISQNPLWL